VIDIHLCWFAVIKNYLLVGDTLIIRIWYPYSGGPPSCVICIQVNPAK